MNRRAFLKLGLAGILTAGSYLYLNNEPMQPTPVLYKKVLCDLHAHPSTEYASEFLLEMLGSPGLVGLAARVGKDNEKILTYEKAVELVQKEQRDERDFSFYEITPGKLARYRDGYFARTQEIVAGIHHLLAVGWEGDYFPYYDHLEEAVQEIHAHDGIAILNHPFIVDERKFIMKLAREEHLAAISKAFQLVDEVEVHNASSIDALPVLLPMKTANDLAKIHAPQYGHLGTTSSDCHRDLEQVKRCGVSIEKRVIDEEGMGGIKHAITMGEFQRYEAYLSRWSFLKGMLFDLLRGK